MENHPHLAQELGGEWEAATLTELLDGVPTSKRMEMITREGFMQHLLRLIIVKNLPFSIVESPELRNLLGYASLGNKICAVPSRTTVAEHIKKNFAVEKEALKAELKQVPGKISFVIDCWTSPNKYAFLGILATWIDKDWILRHCVIDLASLSGPHTGPNIASTFKKTIEEFDLWEDLLSITTDNATNMDTFFEEIDKYSREHLLPFDSRKHRVRCLAHIVNLSCQAILGSVNENGGDMGVGILPGSSVKLIKKIRKGVVAVQQTPQRIERFSQLCNHLQIKSKSIPQDVPTRWNSTLLTLERLTELRKPFNTMTVEDSDLEEHILVESEWEKIKLLIKLLKPFRDCTLKLSEKRSPTISDTMAVYNTLFKHLENYKLKYNQQLITDSSDEEYVPEWLLRAVELGWEKLRKYYCRTEGLVHNVATSKDKLV